MDERKKQLLAVLSIVAVVLGVIIFTSKPVEKKGLVASSEVKQLVVTKDGRIQQGYWFFTLLVDSYSTLSFTLKAENVDVSSQTGVPGSQVVPKKTIDLTLEPLDRPWAYGDIQQFNYVFKGGDVDPQTPGKYYEMPVWRTVGGGWVQHFVPYRLTIRSSDGLISDTKDLLCGKDNAVTLPYGIEVRELGQLLGGVVLPPFDFAYVYGADGKGKFVRDSEIASITTLKTSLGDFRNLDIPLRIVSADPKSETTEDPAHHYKKTKGWPGYETELWCRASARIEYYHSQAYLFGSQTFTWTFEPEKRYPGYDPEVVTYERLAGGNLGGDDREGLLNEYGKRVSFTRLTPEDKFSYQYYGEDGTTGGNVCRRFIFYGPADTWEEAAYQSGIETLPEYDIKYRLEITTTPKLAPYGFVYWNPADPSCSLYTADLRPTSSTISYYVQNKRTVATLLSPQSFRALVQVTVPVQAFDSWVYIPPYGVPEVQEATCDTLEGGKHARMGIRVKNVGLTKDTFYLKDIALPAGVWIDSYPVSEVTLDVGETGTLEFVLTSGSVEKEQTVSVMGYVIAKGSLKTDDFKFDLHLKPGVTSGPQQPGSIVVHVKDKKTGDYISGARVVLDGQFETTTDASGAATFSSVRADGHTILVEKEGYISKAVSVEVAEGQTAHREILLSTTEERNWAKIILMVLVPLALVAGASAWFLKKKGKLKF